LFVLIVIAQIADNDSQAINHYSASTGLVHETNIIGTSDQEYGVNFCEGGTEIPAILRSLQAGKESCVSQENLATVSLS
jgi:hypothetical protein